jgi:DNA-binding HxlR family transcriptional regulator
VDGREVASRPVAESEEPVCAHFQRAAEIVGRRWTPQIVRVLLVGPARYRDLRAGIPSISDHLLSARLKELEAAGIVSRSVDPGTPVMIEYALTPAGEALADVIGALAEWAERWAGTTKDRRSRAPRR